MGELLPLFNQFLNYIVIGNNELWFSRSAFRFNKNAINIIEITKKYQLVLNSWNKIKLQRSSIIFLYYYRLKWTDEGTGKLHYLLNWEK